MPRILRFLPAAAILAAGGLAVGASAGSELPPGVRGDGRHDDTASLQRALDAVGRRGGELFLPSGEYVIAGSLKIPTGVTLRGSWQAPHHGAYTAGSTLLITGGRGREDGPAAIELGQSSAITGFTVLWPEQLANNIVPYPWAIHGASMHNTVENITFVNTYQGIKIGQPFSELHLIRNVFGCVLRRGIFIDTTSDVGRIENVHFNPHYWARSGHPSISQGSPGGSAGHTGDTMHYMQEHLEAFIFGRTDWEYVLNTFVFAAKIGYHFVETPTGACNGQFMGIGGDACATCVQIDRIQPIGIQVTNGEFTSFVAEPNTAVVTMPGAGGAAQFVNCNFWSNPGHAAWLQGATAVTFSACHFLDTSPAGALLAEKGRLIVHACTFDQQGPAIVLKPGVAAAIIMGNLQHGGLTVENGIGARAQVGLNEEPAHFPAERLMHYRQEIGAVGDEEIVTRGWFGQEAGTDGPQGSASARWSTGAADLSLPVVPAKAYQLSLWLKVDPHAVGGTVSAGGVTAPLGAAGVHEVRPSIPASAVTASRLGVQFRTPVWSPHRIDTADGDRRELGIRLFRVEMTAEGADHAAPLPLQ